MKSGVPGPRRVVSPGQHRSAEPTLMHSGAPLSPPSRRAPTLPGGPLTERDGGSVQCQRVPDSRTSLLPSGRDNRDLYPHIRRRKGTGQMAPSG